MDLKSEDPKPNSQFNLPSFTYPTLLCLTLPYPTLPYPTLAYPTLPYPTLPYPTYIASYPFASKYAVHHRLGAQVYEKKGIANSLFGGLGGEGGRGR